MRNIRVGLAPTYVNLYFVSMSDSTRPVKPDEELSQDRRRLKRRRYLAGLSVRAAGAKAGITPAFLSFLELGTRSASPMTLVKLAGAYGCTVADLMPPEPGEDDDEQEEAEAA